MRLVNKFRLLAGRESATWTEAPPLTDCCGAVVDEKIFCCHGGGRSTRIRSCGRRTCRTRACCASVWATGQGHGRLGRERPRRLVHVDRGHRRAVPPQDGLGPGLPGAPGRRGRREFRAKAARHDLLGAELASSTTRRPWPSTAAVCPSDPEAGRKTKRRLQTSRSGRRRASAKGPEFPTQQHRSPHQRDGASHRMLVARTRPQQQVSSSGSCAARGETALSAARNAGGACRSWTTGTTRVCTTQSSSQQPATRAPQPAAPQPRRRRHGRRGVEATTVAP